MPRFIIGAAAFAKALAQVAPVVPTKPVLPLLENVKLQCQAMPDGYELVLTCSNLETTLQVRQPVEAREEWTLCLPAAKLLGTLRALPDQPLTCLVDTDTYSFEIGAARSRYVVAGENPADFPQNPVVKGPAVTVAANVLHSALLAVLPVVGTDELRPNLCGVFFDLEGTELAALAACDGHRLHKYTFRQDGTGRGFIVPTKPAGFLLPLLEASGDEPVQLVTNATSIALSDGRWQSRVIDDRYPDYRNIIPLSQPLRAVVDRDELAAALRRLNPYANQTTGQARLDFGGPTLKLAAEDFDTVNQGSETIDCHYEGEPLAIGFNVPFVLTQLKALPPGAVRLGMSTPNRAWLATADVDESPLLTLLMPVMLNNYV